jgi:hypothetical protein
VCGPSVTGFSFSALEADAYKRPGPGYSTHAVTSLTNTAMHVQAGLADDVAAGTGMTTRHRRAGGERGLLRRPASPASQGE